MGRREAEQKLGRELEKMQSLRHDEKAWRKQYESVRKADAAYIAEVRKERRGQS